MKRSGDNSLFEIVYEKKVVEDDLKRISKVDKDQIGNAIFNKLSRAPEIFGKPLRGDLIGYRRLRVGDYRVIFRIEGLKVKIFAVGHRSRIYKDLT